MYKLKICICILCVIFHFCFGGIPMSDEGGDCSLYGVPGRCTRVRNCPPAIESIQRTGTPGFQRCGFIGIDELVCCPSVNVKNPPDEISSGEDIDDSTETRKENRFTKPKYQQACEEISNDVRTPLNFHIINGEDAYDGEFPHMVALGYDTDEGIGWDCSASIISKRYLLTAAHCLANKRQLIPKVARMGVTLLNDSDPHDYTIKNFTLNPKYNVLTRHNDIALLELEKDIKYNGKIYPACLYAKNDDPLGLIVTGWGQTTRSTRSNVLQKAVIVPTPLDKCNEIYINRTYGSQNIVRSQICASADKIDACLGDSGGPLQIENKNGTFSIVGVVSYGINCGGKVPGVYTRVSDYLEWIESIVWP